jgi:hypothetical protein
MQFSPAPAWPGPPARNGLDPPRPRHPTAVLDEQGTLDGEQVMPGLRIAIADVFRNVPLA